jgi:two-component system LytT family sensor kinase
MQHSLILSSHHNTTMQQRNLPLVFNVVFWLLYFLYEWFGLAAFSGDYRSYFINACSAFPLAFIVSYLTVDILLNKYYDKWPRWKFWVVQIFMSILLLIARRWVNYYFTYPKFFPWALKIPFFSLKWIAELINLYLVVGLYSLFYFVRNWYEQRQQVRDLLQEKTTAELELLKSQVQPHFIFNTLNNIYSTALKTSPETATLISHLSSFLNYNLYDAKQDFVPLTSELVYIKSYIELQRNRYGEKLDTSINVYDDIDDITVAPLLLLPLIENTFKHGIANSIGNSWMRMDISKQNDKLIIKIENSVEKQAEQQEITKGGLGLKNVRRRLELLYPGRHEFKALKELYTYLVVLKIKIL